VTTFTFNKPQLKSHRKELRKNQTPAETKMWQILRNRQFLGLKFFRQYSVENFILDFYCPEIHLGIELDGGQHNETDMIQRDNNRTRIIEKYNIKIIRFWNNDIFKNFDGVRQRLLSVASNSSQPPLNTRGGANQ
jgi:very-short-patch-repair endonuclease